jgi:DNA-binding transcriptional regulator YdaS (Cro superfamily)
MNTNIPTMTPVAQAVALGGGPSIVAAALGISQQAVSLWIKNGKCPAERVIALERICASQVTRYQLRPDLYPLETMLPISVERNQRRRKFA